MLRLLLEKGGRSNPCRHKRIRPYPAGSHKRSSTGGNLDLADELYAPDYVLHDPSLPEALHGPECIKRYAAMTLGAFPDARVTVEDQVAEGDKVVSRWTATGTHTGDLMGIPPTERRIEISGITINRFSGGKIAEDWYQSEDLGMMQQLDVIPSEETSEEASPT
jgi:steroid delta-isomerase-like uncharacterized protein